MVGVGIGGGKTDARNRQKRNFLALFSGVIRERLGSCRCWGQRVEWVGSDSPSCCVTMGCEWDIVGFALTLNRPHSDHRKLRILLYRIFCE